MKNVLLFILLIITSVQSYAQDNAVDMADGLRSSGKIYVVVAVIAVIFIGLIAYMFSIDRRIRKLERNEG